MKITKTYSNLKAAHRQWKHEGHCSGVHGENWTLHVTIRCHTLDDLGFVVDFSGLRGLKAQIDDLFDHTLLIDADDPMRSYFQDMHDKKLAKVIFLPSAASEGIAKYVYKMAQIMITEITKGRAWVCEVVAEEDEKNKAIYEGQ